MDQKMVNVLVVRGDGYGLVEVTYEALVPETTTKWVAISRAAINKHMAEGGMVLWNSKEL